jgi:hypothetical protein
MRPEATRTDEGLLWEFETKSEMHSFVTHLNDLILNEFMFRDISYQGADTVFKPARASSSKMVLMIRALEITLVVSE